MISTANNWRPGATKLTLQRRARLLADIRAFFFARNVLEVDVPVLGLRGVTDVHIDLLHVAEPYAAYLQSSPEYFMKRLLAAGSGSIYCLGKAFRAGELGKRHSPEFTMLEWYRIGWDEHRLVDEVFDLLADLGLAKEQTKCSKYSYRHIFEEKTGIDPLISEIAPLQRLASEVANRDFSGEYRSVCLDLIFSLLVEPTLPRGVVFVHDYPTCQAALAEIAVDVDGRAIARRFEVFCDGMELGNGYFELTDVRELRERFSADNTQRQKMGKESVVADEKLLAAMAAGLPSCAGVAVGVDRLLMNILGAQHIREVLPFADDFSDHFSDELAD